MGAGETRFPQRRRKKTTSPLENVTLNPARLDVAPLTPASWKTPPFDDAPVLVSVAGITVLTVMAVS